jgi:type VI secretion system protein ImpF
MRDLNWLFNTVQMMSGEQAEAMPRVADSVLNYGLPALSGMQASDVDIPWLERTLKRAILAFEPRLVRSALRVKAVEFNSVMDTHNVIEFEITGELWAWGRPIELLLRTKVDLEAGQVVVRDPTERRTPATA